MNAIDLVAAAERLPEAWRSQVLANVGAAQVKLSRMDGATYPEERHTHPEVLVVLNGQMNLLIDGVAVAVGTGEMVRIAAGVAHGVAEGSHGTLLIFNLPDVPAS